MSRGHPLTSHLDHLLNTGGQYSSASKSPDIDGTRIIFPGKVVSTDDSSGMRRIVAKIIQVDTDGKEIPGKDRDLAENQLVTCIPLMPSHFNVMPVPGEMVLLILENFTEGSLNGTRYYIGPIRTTYYNFSYEDFASANRITNNKAKNIPIPPAVFDLIPKASDVTVQGKKLLKNVQIAAVQVLKKKLVQLMLKFLLV